MNLSARHPRGFTLLELLVALAVTSLVVALAFAGFGLIGRSDERNRTAIEHTDRVLLVSQWLARKFETLRPIFRIQDNVPTVFFSGTEAGVLWVAPLPERGQDGGLYVLRLGPLRHPSGQVDLQVQALPFDGSAMQLDWDHALAQVLLADVKTLRWHYRDGSEGQWLTRWDAVQRRYPTQVRLELGDAGGDWPPLVFALPAGR